MAVDPLILQAERKYRAALLAGDTQSRRALFKAYAGTFRSLDATITGLTEQIDLSIAAGQKPSASWLMQQQRYRDLQAQTAEHMRGLAQALGTNLPADQLGAAKAAEMLVGVHSGPVFNKLPAAVVEGVVGTTTSGSPLRTLLDSFNVGGTQDASRFLRSRLIAGIASGTSSARLAQQLSQGVQSLGLSRAMTISRTETQRALRRATALSIAANKDLIAGWVWRSAADETTCAACFSLHGTFFPGDTPMRAHVNCRCVMIPKRRVKDDPMGFGGAVQVGNGAELFKALSADQQRRILGRGRFELYSQGKITLNQARVMRNNAMWGPSYQVKPLRDIKADLEAPPKPPKPQPPPKPTGAPPSAPAVDLVSEAEKTAPVTGRAAPVAPGQRAIERQKTKVAADEARLLEIAEAEKRFPDSVPVLDEAQAQQWRRGEILPDTHIIRIRGQRRDTGGGYYGMGIDLAYDQVLHTSYRADARGHFYNRATRITNATGGIEHLLHRTTRRVKNPGGAESFWTDPNYMRSVMRALPERTAEMNLIISKAAVERRLFDNKAALERMLNPAAHPTRAAAARATPTEVTAQQLQDAIYARDSARAPFIQQMANEYASFDDLARSGDTLGAMINKDIVLQTGETISDYGWAVREVNGQTYLIQRGVGLNADGYARYNVTRLRAGVTRAEVESLIAESGMEYWSDRYMRIAHGLTDDFIRTQDITDIYRRATRYDEYSTLRAVAGKNKPIGEVPLGVSGSSAPIASSTTFAGAPRKWTLRGDKAGDLYGPAANRAKDQVSYRILDHLADDEGFLRSMAENDQLGEWIAGAGRSARPTVVDVAPRWSTMTVQQRLDYLKSGTRGEGYYEWSVVRDYAPGTNDMTLQLRRGRWVGSQTTDGQAFIYDWSSQMVQQWAVTSGDNHILSVALQRAAMEEFALQGSTTLAHFAGRQHIGGFGVPAGDLLSSAEAFYQANGASMQRFLRAMYEQTQEELAWAGITSVKAIRGVGSTPVALAEARAAAGMSRSMDIGEEFAGPVDLQPMSSFAVDSGTANKFGRTLIYVDVPASWVVGTCRTGFGCLNEYEWVVLGGPMQANVFRKGY